jgi:hypothetical protein
MMDFFDLLAATPSPAKKQKIGEHGESLQLTPDMKKCEGAHLMSDVDDVLFEEEHGPVLMKGGRHRDRRAMRRCAENLPTEERLKKWGLDEAFTISGGSRLGCITCMKYGAWCEQEADTKKMKKKKKETKEQKKVVKKVKPAEADGGDEETTHADIQHALQKGTYEPPAGPGSRLKYSLARHLSGSHHKKAAGARADEENEHGKDQDVPSDAQMMFVYDDVKKSPMVPPPPPGWLGVTMDTIGR